MHGFEVLRSLREDPEQANAVVVMISAKSYKPDIDRARAMGADDYVVKPFAPDELVARVESLRADRAVPRLTVGFWGTRGSIAAPGPATTVYGGNTACVELRSGQDILVFDAGTGIRELGLALAQEFKGRALTVHLFISHTHWDHIQGFPFFVPAYSPGTTLHIYGSAGQGRSLEGILSGSDAVGLLPRLAGGPRVVDSGPRVPRRALPDRRDHGLGDVSEPPGHGPRLPGRASRQERRVRDGPRALPGDPRGGGRTGRSRKAVRTGARRRVRVLRQRRRDSTSGRLSTRTPSTPPRSAGDTRPSAPPSRSPSRPASRRSPSSITIPCTRTTW